MVCEKKILYIDDMSECQDKMQSLVWTLNNADFNIELHSRRIALSGLYRALTKNIGKYCLAIIDINLNYNPEYPIWEQTKEGIYIIESLAQRRENLGLKKPRIWATSSNNYEQESINAGADKFIFKKELFSEKGKKDISDFLRGKDLK